MSASVVSTTMSVEEFLELPDDPRVERELIRGELREKPMTIRNRWHCRNAARIAHFLMAWLLRQPLPRGDVFVGEVGCILRRNPDTAVGIDVAYVSAETAAYESENTTLIDGPPILAAEILSPSDKHEEVIEKVDEYLAAGVKLVWVLDPHFRTVVVYRADAEPELFNIREELTAEPHLPGFRCPVAAIFE